MAKVWNKRDPARPRTTEEGGTAIYIGRPSRWGNPYTIGKDGTRLEVIEKYKNWFRSHRDIEALINDLKGKDLVCWCAPNACHGDYLLKLANPKE
jgi:predicted dehydrogenase